MLEYIKISFKSLRTNKVRTFLTMLGVIIGVGAVITLTSIVGGLENTIKKQFESFGSNSLYLFPGSANGPSGPGGVTVNRLRYEFKEKLINIPNIDEISQIVYLSSSVSYKNEESKNIVINGVEENILRVSSRNVVSGEFLSRSDIAGGKMVTVIGNTVKDNLFGNIDPIGKEVKIKGKKFTVIGVLEEQGAVFGQDQDNEVYIPLSVARDRFQIDKPSFLFIKVLDPQRMKRTQRDIETVIGRYIDEEDFTVMSQEQSIKFISNILGILSTALGGIASISLLVGGVGIMNIMFVSVTERTQEIGLRKAVGADSSKILTQFLLEAVSLSLIGGIIGVLFGLGLSALIGKFIDTSPNLFYILLSFMVAAVIGITFGIAPAIRASKMDPIVALRHE